VKQRQQPAVLGEAGLHTDGYEDAGMCSQHVAAWRRNLDLKAWGAEMRVLERDLRKNQGDEDVRLLPIGPSTVPLSPHPVLKRSVADLCNPS
jgi:hypothetical protein